MTLCTAVHYTPYSAFAFVDRSGTYLRKQIASLKYIVLYNKGNLERQETNKYGRGTERHLPKTDESIVRPTDERH